MIMSPYRVYLEVTRACPLQCLHCYADAGPARKEEISLSEFNNLVTQMIQMKISELIISGGEPFIRKDIFDLLDAALIQGLKVSVLTSGIFIDKSMALRLKNYDIDLRFSLDGVTSETHDFIRGKGNLEKVISAISILKEEGFQPLSVHFTVNSLNISEILQLPSFLYRLGIRDVVISTIKPTGRAIKHPELLVGAELMLLVRNRIKIISSNRYLIFHIHKEKNWDGLGCPAAHTKCGITADGRITPCVFLGEEYEGASIREHSLKELWENDEKMNEVRSLSSVQGCSSCGGDGGCRARALYYSGSLKGADPYYTEVERYKNTNQDINTVHHIRGVKSIYKRFFNSLKNIMVHEI